MKTFITDNFLLRNEPARRLYHDYAASMPILDYHNHLPPADIAADRRFENLFDIWLAGDHSKWRLMRNNGIPEELITGSASPYEKFLAFARTLPMALRNPVYHWSHLELLRNFGIDDLLDEKSAPAIWEQANARLADPDMSVWGILRKNRVVTLCTTDDPSLPLTAHEQIASSACPTRVLPTFRPDKAFAINSPDIFNAWIDSLEKVSNCECATFYGFLNALDTRHADFHALGARISDHSFPQCPRSFTSPDESEALFDKVRAGEAATPEETEAFNGSLLLFLAHRDKDKGWTKQIHLGALRNANLRAFHHLGPDTGHDSIGDWSQVEALTICLNAMHQANALPQTILYNINPADNYTFASMVGNFQEGPTAGKIQFGSGWWFLDQKDGMEWQINALSRLGLLSRFVGMLTDSRSFLSWQRHEYFRRILCNILGDDMAHGELPNDYETVGALVQAICYHNAQSYFRL